MRRINEVINTVIYILRLVKLSVLVLVIQPTARFYYLFFHFHVKMIKEHVNDHYKKEVNK